MSGPGWTAILPVKPWALAKSRLSGSADRRSRLARAFALDVLDTLVASESIGAVVVVSAESELASRAAVPRVVVVQDRPLLAEDPLNAAVELGRIWAVSRRPGAPVVVVPSDLPTLRPSDLDTALRLLAQHERAHVLDADGLGTTLTAAQTPALLRTAYGSMSGHAHRRDGSVLVDAVDVRVRRDVDRWEHLEIAGDLGLRPRSRRAVDVLAGRLTLA